MRGRRVLLPLYANQINNLEQKRHRRQKYCLLQQVLTGFFGAHASPPSRFNNCLQC